MINLKMLKAAVASIVLSVSSIANAGLLLEVDLTVENIITINATSGKSLVNANVQYYTGFYLADFFGADTNQLDSASYALITGDLTSNNNTSNLMPRLLSYENDSGLNIWGYTNGDSYFEANQTAFKGQASWNVSEAIYSDALNGLSAGNIYFEADNYNDIDSAQILGTWSTTTNVPEPSSIAILALGILGLASRRFKR